MEDVSNASCGFATDAVAVVVASIAADEAAASTSTKPMCSSIAIVAAMIAIVATMIAIVETMIGGNNENRCRQVAQAPVGEVV